MDVVFLGGKHIDIACRTVRRVKTTVSVIRGHGAYMYVHIVQRPYRPCPAPAIEAARCLPPAPPHRRHRSLIVCTAKPDSPQLTSPPPLICPRIAEPKTAPRMCGVAEKTDPGSSEPDRPLPDLQAPSAQQQFSRNHETAPFWRQLTAWTNPAPFCRAAEPSNKNKLDRPNHQPNEPRSVIFDYSPRFSGSEAWTNQLCMCVLQACSFVRQFVWT